MTTFKDFKLRKEECTDEACIISHWYSQEGDLVFEGDVLLELQNAKASVEITVPFTGTIKSILHTEGDAVGPGVTVATLSSML